MEILQDVVDVIQTIDLIISGYYNIIVDMDYNGVYP